MPDGLPHAPEVLLHVGLIVLSLHSWCIALVDFPHPSRSLHDHVRPRWSQKIVHGQRALGRIQRNAQKVEAIALAPPDLPSSFQGGSECDREHIHPRSLGQPRQTSEEPWHEPVRRSVLKSKVKAIEHSQRLQQEPPYPSHNAPEAGERHAYAICLDSECASL
jgi:hypothetical protein